MACVLDHFKTQEMCDKAVVCNPYALYYVPNHLKTQEMCKETVHNGLCMQKFVPDHLRTQEMCNAIMRIMPEAFHRITDHFKTQELCIKVVQADPLNLGNVLDHLKTKEMCDATMREGPSSLIYVPDWLVMQQHVKLWHDDDGSYDDDDEIIEWYDSYQKRKVQKAKIIKEVMTVAWHPSRWRDWWMSEDKKKDRKIVEVADSCFKNYLIC